MPAAGSDAVSRALIPLVVAATIAASTSAYAGGGTHDFGAGCTTMTVAGRTITCQGATVTIADDVQPACPAFALGQQGSAFTLVCATPNATGLWWSPETNGHGVWISHQADGVFVVTYDYNPNGTPTWRTLIANKDDAGLYVGDVFLNTGPSFAGLFDPRRVWSYRLGGGWVAFDDPDHVRVNLAGDTKGPLTRLAFGPVPVCSFGSASDNVTDLWWAANESGWGVSITQQGATIFMVVYTYGADEQPIWTTSTLDRVEANKYEGTLYEARGPAPPVQTTPVGTASLTFTDANTGTLVYDVPGTMHKIATITRYVISAPGVGCH